MSCLAQKAKTYLWSRHPCSGKKRNNHERICSFCWRWWLKKNEWIIVLLLHFTIFPDAPTLWQLSWITPSKFFLCSPSPNRSSGITWNGLWVFTKLLLGPQMPVCNFCFTHVVILPKPVNRLWCVNPVEFIKHSTIPTFAPAVPTQHVLQHAHDHTFYSLMDFACIKKG